MSAQPTQFTFTPEEQLDLQRLDQNLELFNALKVLLVQGIYSGNAAIALVRCQQLADNLIQNTAQQVDTIKKVAADRGSKKDEPKKD